VVRRDAPHDPRRLREPFGADAQPAEQVVLVRVETRRDQDEVGAEIVHRLGRPLERREEAVVAVPRCERHVERGPLPRPTPSLARVSRAGYSGIWWHEK
jgi:hypothetical protein